MQIRFALAVLVIFALAGCTAPSPTDSVIPTNTAQAQSVALPTNSAAPANTSAPTVALTDTVEPTDTAAPAATPSATPTDQPTQAPCRSYQPGTEMAVFPWTDEGVCLIYLPLRGFRGGGYSLQVPANWTVRLAGPEPMNLSFNEGSKDASRLPLFVQRILITNTALDSLDSVAYSFELSPLKPVVKPSERRLAKKIVTIGFSETVTVLALETVDQDEEIHRYFLPFEDTHSCKADCAVVYVFETRFKQSERHSPQVEKFLNQLQDVVTSIRFIVR